MFQYLVLLWLPNLSIGQLVQSQAVLDGKCSNAATYIIEKAFGVSSIQGIAVKLLGKVQDECTANKCPEVNVASNCKSQSLDDINCEMKDIFSTSLKLGTDDICNAGCDDWPCKAGCNGIDTAICKTSDWVLCKAGCLGISSCVHKCEHAIVDPCVHELIDKCSQKCEVAFGNCKTECDKKLTMQISGDFERLQRVITSANVSSLDLNCSGNGITSALSFGGNVALQVHNAALSIKVHTSDAGISTTNTVDLDTIALTVSAPISGIFDCHVLFHDKDNLTMTVGQAVVSSLNLDVDLKLDKTLDTIAAVVCAGLPFCKDAIKSKIAKIIKDEIVKQVPPQVASHLQPVLQKLASELRCPKLPDAKADASADLIV